MHRKIKLIKIMEICNLTLFSCFLQRFVLNRSVYFPHKNFSGASMKEKRSIMLKNHSDKSIPDNRRVVVLRLLCYQHTNLNVSTSA